MARTRTVPRHPRTRTAALVLGLVLAVAGCGTTTSSPQAVTTGGDRGTTTLELSDLEELLPEASTVGADYRIADTTDTGDAAVLVDTADPDGTGEDGYDAAFARGCPAAYGMLQKKEKKRDDVDRTYLASHGREVDVALSIMDPATDWEMDELRKALSSCSTVKGSENGTRYAVVIHAEANSEHGDKGVFVTMDFTFAPEVDGVAPFDVHLKIRLFRVGAVGATITVLSGVDTSTLTEIPGDFALLDSLADDIESAARALQK